jgi:hypothetical protein
MAEPLWEILGDIPKKKLHSQEEVEQHLNIYMLLRYLSSHRIGVSIAEYLNHNYQYTLYDAYLFALFALPVQVKEIKWISGSKEKKDSTLETIQIYYNCSKETAAVYSDLLDEKSLKYMKRIISRGLKLVD